MGKERLNRDWRWFEVGNGTHSASCPHRNLGSVASQIPLNVFQTLTLGLRNKEQNEEQANEAANTVGEEGDAVASAECLGDHKRGKPVEASGDGCTGPSNSSC